MFIKSEKVFIKIIFYLVQSNSRNNSEIFYNLNKRVLTISYLLTRTQNSHTEKKNQKDCKRNCKWSFLQRWQCPIHNVTLETFDVHGIERYFCLNISNTAWIPLKSVTCMITQNNFDEFTLPEFSNIQKILFSPLLER